MTGAVLDDKIEIEIEIFEKDTGNSVYYSKEDINLLDYDNLGRRSGYQDLQYFSKTIEINNPKLWYPVNLGEPNLYHTVIKISKDGVLKDIHEVDTGIRIVTTGPTAGNKYHYRWNDFLFCVNGKNFFLKGINWQPIDFLYSLDAEKYEWLLTLAKNAGIQLLRVWSGGGMPETDTFYSLCDKLGIMVWQDHRIANTEDTHSFSQEILEAQEAYNIFRTRNHPSLVLHCGGNEFCPYSVGNASSMFVIDRTVRTFDPSRIFHYASPDKGSSHIYRDMEPVWYRHIYKQLPFVGESGIHSFPSYRSLKKLVNERECVGELPDLSSPEFAEKYPELINHFTEYRPDRIPRMLSRASQIDNVKSIDLEGMCEATHVQAYEFYNLMIQSMRENYPVCGGILPWVLNRAWATVGIQIVDGMGQPTYPYYAVKNAYKPLNISLCQQWSVVAPNEEIPIEVKIFNQDEIVLDGFEIAVTIYSPDMSIAKEHRIVLKNGENSCNFDSFILDDTFTDKCFLICADLNQNEINLSRTVYFVKCTSLFLDKDLHKKYRSQPTENLYFNNGPWLKKDLNSANQAVIKGESVDKGIDGEYGYIDIKIENISDITAYPVVLEPLDEKSLFFADDNFFMLKPHETKDVRIVINRKFNEENYPIQVKAWNAEKILIK